MLLRKLRFSILVSFALLNIAVPSSAQVQTASLREAGPWRRVSPTAKKLDGPVLYQIIFRSSATPNHVPAISSNFTLMDSPITVGGGNVAIGGMSVNGSTGVISFANGQPFAGNGSALTNLDAASIATGTVPVVRLPLGSSSDTAAGLIVQTNDPRLLDARPPLAGSSFYIQNTSIPQSASLAITGDATAGGTVSGNVVTGYLQATSAASAPASCTAGNRGQMYFNTSTNQINVCNGSTWGASSGAPANSSGSLLADYEFDEASGTSFADSSGFGNTTTNSIAGIAPGSAGHSGKAVFFAGGTVVAANVPNSPQIYVEAWIYPQPFTTTTTILNKGGIFYLKRIPSGGQVLFGVTINSSSCAPTLYANIQPNTWSHISGWYNGETITVEANGQTLTVACALGPLPMNSNASVVIGADDANGTTFPFSGSIDEVRIWSMAPPPNNLGALFVQGTTSFSTTSTSFVNVGSSLNLASAAQLRYLVTVFLGGTTAAGAGGTANYRIVDDLNNVVFATTVVYPPNAVLPLNFSTTYLPSPGNRTLQVQLASPNGTQILVDTDNSQSLLLVQRLQ